MASNLNAVCNDTVIIATEQASNGISFRWSGRLEDFETIAGCNDASSLKLRESLDDCGEVTAADDDRIYRVEVAAQHIIVALSHHRLVSTIVATPSRAIAQADASLVASHGAAVSILGPDGEWRYVAAPVQTGRPMRPQDLPPHQRRMKGIPMAADITPISPSAALARAMNPQTVADQSRHIRLIEKGGVLVRAALKHPEWVLTGTPDYPTLWHLHATLYADYAPADDQLRHELQTIADTILMLLLSGKKPLSLECFRCGSPKAKDTCCPTHRMSREGFKPWNCADCKTTNAEMRR